MSWLFSRALVGGFSEANSLDGELFAPLKSTPTPQVYWQGDRMKEFSRRSRFGTTCEPLTESLGTELLTWFQEDSRAKILARQAEALESTDQSPDSGKSLPGSFAKWDQNSCSWKTPQCSLLAGLDEFSETWPRWGSMRNGECSLRQSVALNMSEEGYSLLPTPTAHNAKEGNYPGEHKRKTPLLATHAGGKINPEWTEHLMGWPIGWTDCAPLATDKFQFKWPSPGKSFQEWLDTMKKTLETMFPTWQTKNSESDTQNGIEKIYNQFAPTKLRT